MKRASILLVEDDRVALDLLKEVLCDADFEVRAAASAEQALDLARASGIDPRAYDAYLKGSHFQQSLTPSDRRRGVKYLEEAVHLDPAYAPAWAKLAAGYT